jgi:hypothetical protein
LVPCIARPEPNTLEFKAKKARVRRVNPALTKENTMGIRTKASVAANFGTGDIPTQAQFADWIDSSVFIPQAGATGFIEVESTASATNRSAGAFGVKMLAADTTASGSSMISIDTVGVGIVIALGG